ncbi:MAG TPA: hypothetical protein VGM78_15445, partial [Ilumatobacteraceae bacterium]
DGQAHGIIANAIMPSAYSRLTARSPEFAALMKTSFPADRIAPLVGALLSEAAPCTGETFVVGGGRAARVVLATVPGALNLTNIDDCLARFGEIMASDMMNVPANAFAEVMEECALLGVSWP